MSQAQTSRARSSSSRSMRPATVLLALVVIAGLAPAAQAQAQVQTVARVAADTDQFGDKATDAALSVGTDAIVVVTNHGVTMLDKSGTLLAAHKFTDSGFPFKRFGTGTGSVAPSRWFDPRSDYDTTHDRQWMSYSEQNAESGTSGEDDISPLHLAVSRPIVNPNEFDSFTGDDWWFFTGNAGNPGNAGPAFNMQDINMKRYPEGGPHDPFPIESSTIPLRLSLLDLPILAIDETSVYVSAFGIDSEGETSFNFSNIFIIPIEFDDGSGPKSMRDGDRPDESLITSIRLRDMDDTLPQYEKDFHARHYPVQEPEHFEELENAQFFFSIEEDTSNLQQKLRLAGLWFDAEAQPNPRWRYTQHLNPISLDLEDIDVGSGLRFWPGAKGYQVLTPDPDFHPAPVGSFISSAVLTKDTQGDFRVFAAHHVYVDDDAGGVEGVAVQWYVIDPDLDNFRVVQDPPTWNPTLVASGRITTNGTTAGDCYHPVIGVTPQGAAIIEYTFSNDETWPQIRRAALGNTYTSVASNTTVRQGPVNYSYTPSNNKWADYSDMQLDPSGCRLWSVHTLVHNPAGQPPVTITTIDKRDVWLIEIPGNCGNANLNFDESVDLLDVALFNDFYAAGARRVDMDNNGRIDSADEAIFLDAYQEAIRP